MKVTCTIMPISDKSRFAYAHVWSVCVITRSLLVTFANECLTFICRKIRKKEGPQQKNMNKYQLQIYEFWFLSNSHRNSATQQLTKTSIYL